MTKFFDTGININGAVIFGSALTVTDTGQLSDYSPVGMETAYYISWEGVVETHIDGLATGINGRELILANNSVDQVLCLLAFSGPSVASNQFGFLNFGRSAHKFLFPGEQIELIYRNRWYEKIPGAHRSQTVNNFPRLLRATPNTTTSMSAQGIATSSMGGTLSTPGLSSSIRGQLFRTQGATGPTAGTSAGIRGSQNLCLRGNAAGVGGFHFRTQFFFQTIPAGVSWFAGLGPSAAIGNVEVNTLLNIVGVGKLSGDTELRVIRNDNSGIASADSLGTNFPVNGTALYEMHLFALPNAANIQMALYRLDALSVLPFIDTLSADIPVNTTPLTPVLWGNNRATASTFEFSWGDLELRLP